jgi:ABC-type lipoprotein release transport system permease subunit
MPDAGVAVLCASILSVDTEQQIYGAVVDRSLCSASALEGKMIYLSFDDGYVPEYRHTYLVCGRIFDGAGGLTNVMASSVVTARGRALGVTLDKPYLDVTDAELSAAAPAQRVFFEAAEAYQLINSCRQVCVSASPAFLEEFSQAEYTLTEGELYGSDDRSCCVFPETLAKRLGLSVGDAVPLRILPTGGYAPAECYWPSAQDTTEQQTCTLTGVYTAASEDILPIYISSSEAADGFFGYTLGTLRLRNGTTEEQLQALSRSLPDRVQFTVYDQGYGVMLRSVRQLLQMALLLLLLALLAAAVLLTLFAYLFVGRQRQTVQTMYMLGTPRRSLCLYLLSGTGLILLVSSVLGSAAAAGLSAKLNGVVQNTLGAAEDPSLCFSNTNLGVSLPISAQLERPLWLLALCALCVLAAGLALCTALLLHAVRPPKPGRVKEHARRTPRVHRSSRLSGAGRKYLLLSLRRGGLRTAAVAAACAVLTLFLLALQYSLASSQAQRAALDAQTRISCYLTDYRGKTRAGLAIPVADVQFLEESGYFTAFGCSCTDPCLYQGVFTHADGTVGDWKPAVIPTVPDALELFIARYYAGPSLVYTNDLLATAEFGGETSVDVTWLDGYDGTYFTCDSEEKCCLVPESFLSDNGLAMGDTISLLDGPRLLTENYRIIGSFVGRSSRQQLYTSLPNAKKTVTGPEGTDLTTTISAYSCVRFYLKDTAQLQNAKDTLLRAGCCRIRTNGARRLYPVFEDRTYLSDAAKLSRSIGYLQRILPAAAILAALLGAAASVLFATKRRSELATLRSLGTSRSGVFLIFFGEQVLLCLLGCALGLGLWRLLLPWPRQTWLALMFAAGCLPGTAISLGTMLGGDLLAVLREKE